MQNGSPFKMKPLLVGLFSVFATSIAITQSQAQQQTSTTTSSENLIDRRNAQMSAVTDANTTGQANANQADTTSILTMDEPAQPQNSAGSQYSDQYIKNYFTNTGVIPGTPLLAMPQNFRQSAGRYGEFRARSKGDGYHGGIDMTLANNSDDDLMAPGAGVVRGSYYALWMGNTIDVKRDNGDIYQFMHMKNNMASKWPAGSTVSQGDMIGEVGGSGKPKGEDPYAKHLHFTYIIPHDQNSRWRNLWLSENSKNIGSSRFSLHNNKHIRSNNIGLKTDPTPYLAEDLKVKPDGYTPWLGSTIRQQFNVLYNTQLPVGPEATSVKPLPTIPVFNDGYEWTPDMLASARSSLVKGAEYSDWSGYQGAFSSGAMSYQALSSFISSNDGDQFGSLPQPAEPVSIEEMTPRQIIDAIGGQRLGNAAWEKQMLKLSSKGLLTEYTMMTAADNYLEQQNQRLRNRVELLIAGLTQSRLFEFNKKIEALQVTASAEAVPGVLDIELVDLGYAPGSSGGSVDPANLPNELNALVNTLMDAIAAHEGQWNSYNTGTKGKCDMSSYVSDSAAKATGTPLITTMTPREIYASAYGVSNCVKSRKFTAGKFQVTYYTLAGETGFGTGGFIASYPQYADKPMTPQVQEFIARNYLMLGPKRPILRAFLESGRGSVRAAQYAIAKEWASVGVPAGLPIHNDGRASNGYTSYYDGANNSANAGGTDVIVAVLRKISEWHAQNPGKAKAVLSGESPDISMNSASNPNTNTANATGTEGAPAEPNNTSPAEPNNTSTDNPY